VQEPCREPEGVGTGPLAVLREGMNGVMGGRVGNFAEIPRAFSGWARLSFCFYFLPLYEEMQRCGFFFEKMGNFNRLKEYAQ
jgi:hypothetical protein